MNRQRDIERVLETWLLDGPSVMPDRLFDAVLDRVERVPQRRLARLHLRLTEMNPRIRYFTVLAAALLTVAAGLAVTGGGTNQPVKATSSPATETPSPKYTTVADGLLSTWMGEPAGIDGLDPAAGVMLVFTPIGDGFWMTQSQESNLPRLVSRAAPAGPNAVTLTTTNTKDCPDDSSGTYEWALSPSGETLTLTAQADTCAARLAAVPGTYWRMNCPAAGDNCLGPVDGGTYSSQFFDPFVPHGGAWTPRYGALQYTVPEGWENREDWPESFGLGPVDAPGGPFIQFASGVVAVKDDDMCSHDPNPTAGRTAADLATWVAAAAGVETAGAPEAITVGGLPAWRLDVRIADGWTAKCPWNETEKPDRSLFTDVTPGDGFHWGIPSDASMRIWLVDLGDGRALLVDFEAETQAAYDAGLVEATEVVGSLVLNR